MHRIGSWVVTIFVFSLAAASAARAADDWPVFRGDPQGTGVARCELPATPALLWKFPVKGGSFEATPAIVDGVAYLGDMDGKLFALDLQTGTPKWEVKMGGGFIASPSVRDGRLYLGDLDGSFFCVKTADGTQVWKHTAEAEIDSSANFFQDKVLVGSQDATLYCLDAKTGQLAWKHELTDQIRCSPTIVEGHCFLAGCDGRLHVVELTAGREVGSVPINSPTGVTPAARGNRVFVGTESGEFFGIDWKAAKVLWTYPQEGRGHQPFRSCPALTEQAVVFGGRDRRVHAVHPETGKERWTFTTAKRNDSSPVIAGQRAFIGSGDGRLYAFDLMSGKPVWQYEAGGGFVGSPAVASGRLVIASDDGVVYCFGGK